MSRTGQKRKNPHAQALARKAVAKGVPEMGGKARWAGVPIEERRALARKAILARWRRHKKQG